MNGVSINSDKQHRTVHRARIDERALLALAVDYVAQQLGLDASAASVKIDARVGIYHEGSFGTRQACIEIELIEDHGTA